MTDRAADVTECPPGVIDQVVGQKGIVERIKVALEAAWNDGVRFPHALMTGPPGLGKSLFAKIIANEMGCELLETLAQNLWNPNEIHGLLIQAGNKDVILIDECDELHAKAQTQLYRALEDGCLFLCGDLRRASPKKIPLRRFTLLACSNHEASLVPPLRDRFRLILRFAYYSPQELAALLRQRAARLRWEAEPRVIESIASLGRGTPRIALRLLESCHRTARSQNKDVITFEHFRKTCQLEAIDDRLGLDDVERGYLAILADSHQPTRLQTISRRLGLPPRTVSKAIEEFLVRQGLVATSDAGRELTNKGIEYLRQVDQTA